MPVIIELVLAHEGRVPEGLIVPVGEFHKQRGAAAATTVSWSPKRRPNRCAVKPTEGTLS